MLPVWIGLVLLQQPQVGIGVGEHPEEELAVLARLEGGGDEDEAAAGQLGAEEDVLCLDVVGGHLRSVQEIKSEQVSRKHNLLSSLTFAPCGACTFDSSPPS